jgi:geranylgeranyl diphosphate synthase type I
VTRTESTPTVLSRARALVAVSLAETIGRLSAEVRPLVEYHLGWVDADGRSAGNNNGGKGVRPAITVLAAEAVGAPAERGVPGAVAVELVHNFSLVHDDVIDNDAERRHRPTVWATFGVGRAIIAGDALLALAQEVVLEAACDAAAGVRAARALALATSAMISGQALDMAFETMSGVTIEGCLEMEAAKTGALLGCAASLGALLGEAPDPVVEALREYGVQLGLAFQAVDDLLGIWGDPAATGKPAWSDLRTHKKTLPVAAAQAMADGHAGELTDLLGRENLAEADVARLASLVEDCGGREATILEARTRLARSLAALDSVELVHGPREELANIARFVVERDF